MEGVTVTVLDPLPASVEAFALSSWLRGHERVATLALGIARGTYYRTHHPELTRLLRRSRVALAALEADPDCYLGWACGMPTVLHYVYVKYAYREHGLGDALVSAVSGAPTVYTFAPGDRFGRVRTDLIDIAERRGWRYHAHPVPGVDVLKQHEAREDQGRHGAG